MIKLRRKVKKSHQTKTCKVKFIVYGVCVCFKYDETFFFPLNLRLFLARSHVLQKLTVPALISALSFLLSALDCTSSPSLLAFTSIFSLSHDTLGHAPFFLLPPSALPTKVKKLFGRPSYMSSTGRRSACCIHLNTFPLCAV